MAVRTIHFRTTALAALFAAAMSEPLRAADPPATLALPPNVIAAGTTTTVNGQPWAYLIWNVTAEGWLEANDVAVHLKAGSAGTFQLQAVMSPMTDPNAIKPWIVRAAMLGDDPVECASIAATLHQQWKDPANPEPLPASLENRLSMLGVRASQQPQAAAALRQLGNAHPLYRFVSATAWSGPMGVNNGQEVVIELRQRNRATGAEGSVVGRVTLTAGAVEPLAQPGAPLQVPPGFPATLPTPGEAAFPVPRAPDQIDLGVALRWAIPEALRRQIQLTRGFHVWRLAPGYTPPGGLNGASLLAAEASAPAQVRRLTRNPGTASRVFRSAGSSESGPAVDDFAADRTTWFVVDDNNRYATGTDPGVVTGTPYTEGQSFEYVVAAVDLLGRIGPVSARGTGVAAFTVPPAVPDVLRVENIMKNGSHRLRVVWKPNAAGTGSVPATHYLVYRDRVKNAAPGAFALNRSTHPAGQSELVYIGAVAHPSTPGATLSLDDDALVPQPSDYGQTYFYCVRAAHLGPLGYNISSPSPAVFGTMRDRTGPAAPSGYTATDCPRVGIKFDEADNSPENLGTAGVRSDRVAFRLEARRGTEAGRWKDIEWIVFGVSDLDNPGDLSNRSPFLFYGSGDLVWTELMAVPSRRGYAITVLGGNASGRFSHLVSFTASSEFVQEGHRYRIKARAIGAPVKEMAPPGMEHAEYWTPYFTRNGSPTVAGLSPQLSTPTTYRASFSGAPAASSRSLLVQRSLLLSPWSNWDAARLPANTSVFFFAYPGLSLMSSWRAWEIVDPAGSSDPGSCPHDARPQGAGGVSPVKVVLMLPPGAKEYRLYRRIENGPLTLLQQDTETWDDGAVQAVMVSDGLIPPAGGRIGYYGQVFDEHGNPSPLVLLGEKVTAMPELPIPTMDPAGSGGTLAAPTMILRAFAPSPGVEHLELAIDPPPPTPPAGMTAAPRLGSKLFNFKPGMPQSHPADYTSSLIGPAMPQQDPSVPVILNATVGVKAGVEYKISVRAIGIGGKLGNWSAPQVFTWSPPLTGDTVAWPAKPIPRLVSWNPLIKAFRLLPEHVAMSQYRFIGIPTDSFPVAIRIGRVPLTSTRARSNPDGDPSSNWDVRGTRFTDEIIIGYLGIDDAVGFTSTPSNPDLMHTYLAPKLTGYGDITSIDTTQKLFPIVLYRRQTARLIDGVSVPTPDTDIIQASSMINAISWVPDPVEAPTLALFIDPFVSPVMLEPNPAFPAADLCLFDNSPVAAGATYQYYLVHFNSGLEPESIIDAGTLTFPEAP